MKASPHPTIKGVLFDKDGVLLDLSASWFFPAKLLGEYCAGLGKADVSQILSVLGVDLITKRIDPAGVFASDTLQGIYKALREAFPDLEQPLSQRFIQQKIEEIMLNHDPDYLPLGQVKQTLHALHTKGYLLAVLTNDSAEFTEHALRKLDIAHYFTAVMSADLGFGGKPNTGGLHEILRVMHILPKEAVMVGDTKADVEVARNGNLRHFIGVSEEYPKPTASLTTCRQIIPDISLLPDLLCNLD